jgi:type IV pilus assembly protein PilW
MKLTIPPAPSGLLRQRGFSLIELMISVVISLVVLAGLSAMLVNVSRTNAEMAKSNSQIENGRFAVQALESDLIHAGFWGQYVPQFDDMSYMFRPGDAPTALPDPCRAYVADDFNPATTADWDFDYINNLLGIAVHVSADAPGNCVLDSKVANTDVVVVRHAATCIAGEANCDAQVAGRMYFQSSMCVPATWGTVQPAGNTLSTIALVPPSHNSNTSAIVNGYVGMRIRMLTGAGAGQTRLVSGYTGPGYIATVTPAWTIAPAFGDTYTIVDEALSSSQFPLRKRSCLNTDPAEMRHFESTIYYIRNYAATAGDGIPTLVRRVFDPITTPGLAHQAAEALVEGIERFSVEVGIDDTMARCGLNLGIRLDQPVSMISPASCSMTPSTVPSQNTLPINRGDGAPDRFVRCTTAAPCTAAQLQNAVATKLFLLVRNTEPTYRYVDSKTYCLGTIAADGSCPDSVGPFNDGYKRHLFSTTVRLTSISGRRETP